MDGAHGGSARASGGADRQRRRDVRVHAAQSSYRDRCEDRQPAVAVSSATHSGDVGAA